MAKQTADRIAAALEPVVTGMGYEWVGVEYIPQRGSALLRIYIDAPAGVTVDDCALVSHQVSGVLDVEDIVKGRYYLEVSSPGADRPLFTREHYQRFCGQKVQLRMAFPLEGRRKFSGVLQGLENDNVLVLEEDRVFAVPLAQIEKARLVPDFSADFARK